VRDSSGKPATCVACEVQTWHATSLSAYSPTPKRSAGDTPLGQLTKKSVLFNQKLFAHYIISCIKNRLINPFA
jgi:hypothetical protein